MVAEDRGNVLSDAPLRTGTTFSRLLPALGHAELIVIDDLVAVAIQSVRKYIAVKDVCDIPVMFKGSEIGSICLLSQITQSESTISSLTTYQYAAYLALAPLDAISTGSWVPFGFDALIINRTEFWTYWKNRGSSTLWGGFMPLDNPSALNLGKVKSDTASITMYSGCSPRTARHQECLELATLSTDLTERFLHLYHYLELDYDYEIVSQIKLLDENDPRGLWEALKSQQVDTERLFHVLKNYSDISRLEKLIEKMQPYKLSAIRIFYDYGKDSNPIKSEDAFNLQFLSPPSISQSSLDSLKKKHNLSDDFAGKATTYESKLKKLVCYWIYRFRCSIAHNKLGEYYLNRTDDMDFLSEFGEPLLCEMVRFRMAKN